MQNDDRFREGCCHQPTQRADHIFLRQGLQGEVRSGTGEVPWEIAAALRSGARPGTPSRGRQMLLRSHHQQILPDLLFVHHIRDRGGKVRIVEHEIEEPTSSPLRFLASTHQAEGDPSLASSGRSGALLMCSRSRRYVTTTFSACCPVAPSGKIPRGSQSSTLPPPSMARTRIL